MGIAKSIKAYGIYPFYSPNIEFFLSKLAELVAANFAVTFLDTECNFVYENKTFDFGNQTSLKVFIQQWEYTIENKKQILPTYCLYYPINYEFETELEIDFYQNNVCAIRYLTFEHLWKSFISTLRFDNHWLAEARKHSIVRYNNLRTEYLRLLKKLNINSILILTDAYYDVEEISDPERYLKPEFKDIIQEAETIDKLSLFELDKILLTKKKEELPKEFLLLDELRIAFFEKIKIY